MRKQAILMGIILVLGLGWGAYSAAQGTLIVANTTDAITADPHVNIYNYSTLLQKGPYEGLILIDQAGTIHPRLAASWDISEDGLAYTFHLQEGVSFTDGTPFNAEAVKYNMERLLALGLHGSTYMPKSVTATVVEEYVVRLTLEEPYPPFLAGLNTVLMVSPAAAQANEADGDWGQAWLDQHAVGTGPYLLETWEKDQFYRLVQNQEYWQGWDGDHYGTIIVRIVPEQATRVQLLQTGEIDAALEIGDDAFLTMLEIDPDIAVNVQPTGEVVYLRMKNRGALTNPKVRQAMLYIFPYSSFWQDVQRGRGATVHGFIAPAVFGHDEMLPVQHQDLGRAKELLIEAGYGDGLTLDLWILSSYLPLMKPVAELFKEAGAKVGITVEIQDLASAGTFLGGAGSPDVNEGPDMFGWGQAPGINSPLTAPLGMWYSLNTPPGRNYTHYSNPEFDALYVEAARTVDDAARLSLYSEMQELLYQNPPAVPIGTYNRYICTKQGVSGLAINLAGVIIDWYAVGPVTP